MSQRRVTIVEIAKQAGVSAQTVSRVVNGRTNVAEETRDKVQAIIDRLGYHPSRLARSLLQGRSHTLGVIGYGLGLGLFGPSQMMAGILYEANRQGYSVLPLMLNEPQTENPGRLIGELLEYHVDGIIWAVPEIGDNRAWMQEIVTEQDVPLIFMSMEAHPDLTVISVDNRAGGQMATQHLIERGCRTIGLIQGQLDWWEAHERERGWRETMAQNGLPIDQALIESGDWSAGSGERAMRALLQRRPDLDGVFVCNDSMAVGALKVARELGRRVPDDLAIIGFDDIPEAAYFYPALTTIRQNLYDLGSRTVVELDRLINKNGQESPPSSILITPKLVVRDST